MLATVVIDPPSAAALGAIFTLFGARSRSALVGALVGGWMGLCFGVHAFKYPAWMLVYLVDPRALPTALWYPFFLAALIGCGALGAYVAGRVGRKNALWFAIAMLAVWGALFALTFKRYLVVGTYDDFWSGRARPLSDQPAVVRDFNLVTLVTAVPLVLLLGGIIRHDRQRRDRHREQAGGNVPEIPGMEAPHRGEQEDVRE
jgi:hypothetical protein